MAGLAPGLLTPPEPCTGLLGTTGRCAAGAGASGAV
eukprot:CAMPEP_0116972128 /NCGR_PEP_ID=MMETSP0467-20121206/53648_1 /TAXON_ID=283647 /ORGANISM="Mesodinium pulex, Strain SPMC105" /LENGTH=35 /DNA_ID= /DNA_START= /DNA_END= /DNA_ORIENTATION=